MPKYTIDHTSLKVCGEVLDLVKRADAHFTGSELNTRYARSQLTEASENVRTLIEILPPLYQRLEEASIDPVSPQRLEECSAFVRENWLGELPVNSENVIIKLARTNINLKALHRGNNAKNMDAMTFFDFSPALYQWLAEILPKLGF